MDPLKEAFQKIKQDIESLQNQIELMSQEIGSLKQQTSPTHLAENPTLQHIIPTHHMPLQALKPSKTPISTGNEGVPTNKPTNQPTNQHIGNEGVSLKNNRIDQIERVSEILKSLDALKKEVRVKFKRLTNQEMLIFTSIYQFEEQNIDVDYQLLAEKLSLTEISIRDYIGKIIKKGIPISKIKQNNKKVILKVSEDLKKIASLQTILQLRQL